MKLFRFLILGLLIFGAAAFAQNTPVPVSFFSKQICGVSGTVKFTVRSDDSLNPQTDGINLIGGFMFTFTATNGVATNYFMPGSYWLNSPGWTHQLHFQVPETDVVMNVTQLITNGLPVFLGYAGITAANAVNWSGLTNFLSQLSQANLLVSPNTNFPVSILTNGFYFSPWLGSNYVQQAVNALPQYASRYSEGGGSIQIAGLNYLPSPLVVSNNKASVASYTLFSENANGGALICATNPCIRVFSTNASIAQFNMRNLIVASIPDQTTNLFEMAYGQIGKVNIQYNWFGLWDQMTNHNDLYGGTGLTFPAIGLDWSFPQDLLISLDSQFDDDFEFAHNSLIGIQSVDWDPDHGSFHDNFFTFCAAQAYGDNNAPLNPTTDWTTNSIYGIGAAVIVRGNINSTYRFYNNYFYGTYMAYASEIPIVTWNDGFEENTYDYSQVNSGTVTLINPYRSSGKFVATTFAGGYITPTDVYNGTSQTETNQFAIGAKGITGGTFAGTFNGPAAVTNLTDSGSVAIVAGSTNQTWVASAGLDAQATRLGMRLTISTTAATGILNTNYIQVKVTPPFPYYVYWNMSPAIGGNVAQSTESAFVVSNSLSNDGFTLWSQGGTPSSSKTWSFNVTPQP